MAIPPEQQHPLAEALEALRRDVARLSERLAALEAATGTPSPAPTVTTPPPVRRPLDAELIAAIAAAVAAYLGKKAPIRQIRLAGSAAWIQQGRVGTQSSHDV